MVAAEVLGPADLLQGPPLWLVPVPNGTPRRLGNLTGWFAALSPDGERVVAFQTSGLVVARRDGSEFRRLGAGAVSRGRLLRWSPDGQKLRVQAAGPDGSTL